MRYVTKDEMKAIDRYAIEERGILAAALMENAGRVVAKEAMKLAAKGRARPSANPRAFVFAGYGNNGGDGLVAARYLAENGYKVSVFFVGRPKSLSPETNSKLESILELNIRPASIVNEDELKKLFEDLGKPNVIIDAIFGIGIRAKLDDLYIKIIERINALGSPIVAVDVPSGLDADTGESLGGAIKAAVTVTFGWPKVGFKNEAAKAFIGKLVVADIGFPEKAPPVEKASDPPKANNMLGQTPFPRNDAILITLRDGRLGRLRQGHPWIFKNQIKKPASSVKAGNIARIIDAGGKFIGKGYYNPKSEIIIRILTFQDDTIDVEFFTKRIRAAKEKRAGLFSSTNAYRTVFSESDGLPGIVVDIYNDTAVFQIFTLGMDRLKDYIVEAIKSELKPSFIYEKSDSAFRTIEGLQTKKGWHGTHGSNPIEIFEGKARFFVNVESGHKTGFYLDQRRSRLSIGQFCKGKKVLDLFSYTGGFAVNAAIGGAESVLGIDIKEEWLTLGRKNASLNGVQEAIILRKGDAFSELKKIYDSGERFDIIIIDPPSFLRKRESLKSASKGYMRLNSQAMKIMAPGGVLCTFSCSHNMPWENFSSMIKESALDAKRKFEILKRCHQDMDHPITNAIPETEYLKGYFLRALEN